MDERKKSMAEYVSKSTLYGLCGQRGITYLHVSDIDNMPAADVALVVHGRWGMHSDRPDTLICSICDHAFDVWKHDIDRMHYCPNCGSKMDAEKEDQNALLQRNLQMQ